MEEIVEVKKTLKKAIVQTDKCVACGACVVACPKGAIEIENGICAKIDMDKCVGCGMCARVCPASAVNVGEEKTKHAKNWYEYLYLVSALYMILGFFNILFAWLGLLCFFIPLIIAIIKGNKSYCNKYCGRSQLLTVLGEKMSYNNKTPKILRSKYFRYGFLIFFLAMFVNMIFITVLVFNGAKDMSQVVTLFWSFKIGWGFAYYGNALGWVAQFALGFYSIMLTSTSIGIIMMILFKPRSWCAICPMGTMTQLICKIKNKN